MPKLSKLIRLQFRRVVTSYSKSAMAATLVLALVTACSADDSPGVDDDLAPTINSVIPANAAMDVDLGGDLAITFSEAMNADSVNSASVVLTQGSRAIAGAVAYNGVTATFRPTTILAPHTSYTGTVSTEVEDLAGNALASDYVWQFTTGVGPDTVAPMVSTTLPANNAVDVALGGDIAVTFSEAMAAATINSTTMTLKQGALPIAGSVTYSGVTATFAPDAALEESTLYHASVQGVKDLADNELAGVYEWAFTTGSILDTTHPYVSATIPTSMAIDVGLGGDIAMTFSEAMDALTITTSSIELRQGATSIPGTVTYNGITATFNPSITLASTTVYTASVGGGAKDLAGNVLEPTYAWSFTTGVEPDTTRPSVVLTIPPHGSTTASANERLRIEFSEAMNPSTLTTATFTLSSPGGVAVPGTLSYSGAALTFRPLVLLALGTKFRASLATSVRDLAGNQIAEQYNWEFTTSSTPSSGPAGVVLGTAYDYVILAKSGIASVPTSKIVGDIGVSPISSTALTGFGLSLDSSSQYSTSRQVDGHVRAADYAAPTPANLALAINDMQFAYTDAANRLLPDSSELGAGEIGGLVLDPGLYKWSTGVSITNDLTLDGGPNDVWIFQIAGDLTQAGATRILLTGGAMAKNVFWQSHGRFNIGTDAHFEGIALGQTAIVLGTRASVNGRLLAQSAVTLDSSVVIEPVP